MPVRARIPAATSRLQLGPGLTFDDAAGLVPYLAAMGISDCYISPFFETSSESSHGYDVSDHHRIRRSSAVSPHLSASRTPSADRTCACSSTSSRTTCASPGTVTGGGWTSRRTAPTLAMLMGCKALGTAQ